MGLLKRGKHPEPIYDGGEDETSFSEFEPTELEGGASVYLTAASSGVLHPHHLASDRGKISVPGFPFTIGRFDPSERAGLSIDNRSVSRLHAEITEDRGVYFITDVGTHGGGSKGGTFVNGERLPPGVRSVIKNGDRLMFYKTEYDFHVDGL